MGNFSTVFAIMPAAAAAETSIAAFRALPLSGSARLVGLYVAPVPVTFGPVTDIALASYIEAQFAAAKEESRSAEKAFSTACERASLAFEWRADRALDRLVSPQAGSMARAADIIVCPQLPDEGSTGRHEIEEVVFCSGRPVIALPPGWKGEALSRRVLVAWDGGREAARAVFDALPLLSKAEAVRIVSVQGFSNEPVRQFTPADDISATLSRHGLKVEVHSFRSTRSSVKEELAVQALEFGADITVMGCYGHSRFRERILGGVSRDMLKDMPGPLMLAN
jgi:nucleotide-binding universal stress UspA family protein